MTEKNSYNNLENPENWDYEHLVIKEPVKSPRVVVSVAFSRNDFTIVSQYAQSIGKKTSEFIRESTLEKVKEQDLEIMVYDFGSTGSLWFDRHLPSSTRVHTLVKEHGIYEPVITY
jgi:hypothetical protein